MLETNYIRLIFNYHQFHHKSYIKSQDETMKQFIIASILNNKMAKLLIWDYYIMENWNDLFKRVFNPILLFCITIID